jgi:hypothetical protein
MQSGSWFPDEDVCRRGEYAGTPMVRNQKRIARATDKDRERGCFSAEMLAGITKIGKGTKGLDAETPITAERAVKWLSGFKGRKPLTDEQRAVLRARVLKMRAAQLGPGTAGAQRSKAPETLGAKTESMVGRTAH